MGRIDRMKLVAEDGGGGGGSVWVGLTDEGFVLIAGGSEGGLAFVKFQLTWAKIYPLSYVAQVHHRRPSWGP